MLSTVNTHEDDVVVAGVAWFFLDGVAEAIFSSVTRPIHMQKDCVLPFVEQVVVDLFFAMKFDHFMSCKRLVIIFIFPFCQSVTKFEQQKWTEHSYYVVSEIGVLFGAQKERQRSPEPTQKRVWSMFVQRIIVLTLWEEGEVVAKPIILIRLIIDHRFHIINLLLVKLPFLLDIKSLLFLIFFVLKC